MTSGISILLIDDDPAVLESLVHLLEDLATIDVATNGLTGLSMAAKLLPDLIICNVHMADVGGLMICKHLQGDARTRNISILCISSDASENDEIAVLQAGAVDVIKKTSSPTAMRARIMAQIRLHQKAEILADIARRDRVTGLFNRRYFNERLNDEWGRHRRAKEMLTIAVIDIRKLNNLLEPYGFATADMRLMTLAYRLRNAARRPGEIAARLSGNQFGLLLPRTNAGSVDCFARHVCANLNAMDADAWMPTLRLNAHVGLANLVPDGQNQPPDMVRLANEAMKSARANGNCFAILAG